MSTTAKSIAEQGTEVAMTLLGATGSPASEVSRSELDQVTQDRLPLFDVTPGTLEIQDPGPLGDHGSVTRVLPLIVRAVLNSDNDESALDPFHIFAAQQLTSGAAAFRALGIDVDEATQATVFKPNGRNILGLEMTFHLSFATKRGDPTQKG